MSAHIIVGNQSADLDSVVSAYALTELLKLLFPNETFSTFVICDQKSFKYHLEVIFTFEAVYGNEAEHVLSSFVYTNTINVHNKTKMYAYLVDTQKTEFPFETDLSVISIIDHHAIEVKPTDTYYSDTDLDVIFFDWLVRLKSIYSSDHLTHFKNTYFNKISIDYVLSQKSDIKPFIWVPSFPVGSCASMIGGLWKTCIESSNLKNFDTRIIQLLAYTIAKDTYKFCEQVAGIRWCQFDIDIYNFLLSYNQLDSSVSVNPTQFVDNLYDFLKRPTTYKDFSCYDLLRADWKVITIKDTKFSFSTFFLPLSEFLSQVFSVDVIKNEIDNILTQIFGDVCFIITPSVSTPPKYVYLGISFSETPARPIQGIIDRLLQVTSASLDEKNSLAINQSRKTIIQALKKIITTP